MRFYIRRRRDYRVPTIYFPPGWSPQELRRIWGPRPPVRRVQLIQRRGIDWHMIGGFAFSAVCLGITVLITCYQRGLLK